MLLLPKPILKFYLQKNTDETSENQGHKEPEVKNAKKDKPKTSSFIEELVKVKFKSTVTCSICSFQSNKYETDMMLSLPLPQSSNNVKLSQNSSGPKSPIRRSLYAHLILSNAQSIKHITASQSQNFSSTSSASSGVSYTQSTNADYLDSCEFNPVSKSKFYMPESMGSNDTPISPYHVKIGVNIHVSNDNSFTRDLANSNSIKSATSTVVNPDFNDLKTYFKNTYNLEQSDLIFVDLNRTLSRLSDVKSVKKVFFPEENTSDPNEYVQTSQDNLTLIEDSMCIVELHQKPSDKTIQLPLINIIALNVYFVSNKYAFDQNSEISKSSRKFLCYGLPFAVLINRDCSYAELCKKLLESQSKYLRDKNILKYKVNAF